jgi:hypothetical protein
LLEKTTRREESKPSYAQCCDRREGGSRSNDVLTEVYAVMVCVAVVVDVLLGAMDSDSACWDDFGGQEDEMIISLQTRLGSCISKSRCSLTTLHKKLQVIVAVRTEL